MIWLKRYSIYASNFLAGGLISNSYLYNLPNWFVVFPAFVLGLSALHALIEEIHQDKHEAKK